MALATADARLFYAGLAQAAFGFDLHRRLHKEERLMNARYQGLVFTGVGGKDAGHRALIAQARLPLQAIRIQQAAAFDVAAAEVIAVKVLALFACWRDHARIIAGQKAIHR